MKLLSELSCDSYLSNMKYWMESVMAFGEERFTGIFLGRFFSVTFHSGYEWNQRITNEKHRAIGFVCPAETGTKVYCIRLAGMTNPLSLLGIYAFGVAFFMISGLPLKEIGNALLMSLIVTLVLAGWSAFTSSVTEKGIRGSEIMTRFLTDPTDPYGTK